VTAILVFVGAGLVLQLALWALQQRTLNAASADVGWVTLVTGGTMATAVSGEGDLARRIVVAALVGIWGFRLGFYLLRDRVLARAPEDGRYRWLRARWGAAAPRRFLVLYLAQIPMAALFILPVAAAMRGGPPDAWTAAGIGVWVVGAVGEWLADRQLARFRADPRNRGAVCRAGLWRFSRHPNYFFEWVHWWAYVLIGRADPITFIGPLVMLLFLFRVTGIPYTERQALRSRGDAYLEYQRTTSAFIPWPPRRLDR
jgi:steroid 5-alpha reductase family enzyme